MVIQQIDAAIQRMDSSEPDHLDEAVDGNTGNTRIIIDTTKWVSHTDGFRDAIQKANLSTLWPYSKAIQEVMNIVLEQIGKEGGWNVHAESGTTNDVNKDSIPDKIILEEPILVTKKKSFFRRVAAWFE